MEKVIYAILKNYKEIEYLRLNVDDFDINAYLNNKGIYVGVSLDNEIVDRLMLQATELQNYPKPRAREMSQIILKNFINDDCRRLKDIANDLDLTYSNAYKLRVEAIEILSTLVKNPRVEEVVLWIKDY